MGIRMTIVIRKTDKFTLFMEVFTQSTAVLENKTGAISNWNTGSDAIDEIRGLILVDADDFDNYCSQIEKS